MGEAAFGFNVEVALVAGDLSSWASEPGIIWLFDVTTVSSSDLEHQRRFEEAVGRYGSVRERTESVGQAGLCATLPRSLRGPSRHEKQW